MTTNGDVGMIVDHAPCDSVDAGQLSQRLQCVPVPVRIRMGDVHTGRLDDEAVSLGVERTIDGGDDGRVGVDVTPFPHDPPGHGKQTYGHQRHSTDTEGPASLRIMAEGRDWTEMVGRACPDCGFDASLIGTDEFDSALEFEADAWRRWLSIADESALRSRPTAGVWSGLEYACHVRDLFAVFAGRVDQLREGEAGPLQWWDHEAAAITDGYNEAAVGSVIDELGTNAMILSAATIGVVGAVWSRSAERRPGEVFTLADLVRFALHESFHHRLDAQDAVNKAS